MHSAIRPHSLILLRCSNARLLFKGVLITKNYVLLSHPYVYAMSQNFYPAAIHESTKVSRSSRQLLLKGQQSF